MKYQKRSQDILHNARYYIMADVTNLKTTMSQVPLTSVKKNFPLLCVQNY